MLVKSKYRGETMKNAILGCLLLGLAVGASAGCHKNPYYCENAVDNNCANPEVDARVDASKACTASAECTGTANVCDVNGTKTCVECVVSADCQMAGDPATSPVCGADHACHACTQNSECASSELCLPSGACAVETEVAYVDAAGTDNTTCSKGMPCTTLTKAQLTGRGIVRVKGVIKEASVVYATGTTLVIGTPNAKIEGNNGGQNLIQMTGTASVEFVNLAVGGTGGTKPTNCIALIAGTPTLKVTGGRVENCQGGITSSGGTVTVTGATVTANGTAGITSSGGTVTVTGATVTANKGGGISVTAGGFKIANCIIAKNGDDTSDFGGVNLTTTTTTHQFDNNTVVFNHQKAGALGRPGVNCTVTAFAGQQNIITSNDEATAFGAQTAGACTYTNSFVMPGMAAGANELKFKDIATNNYHLTSNSPNSVKDVPGLTSCTGSDFDGDMRPVNSLCDLGADELGPLNP